MGHKRGGERHGFAAASVGCGSRGQNEPRLVGDECGVDGNASQYGKRNLLSACRGTRRNESREESVVARSEAGASEADCASESESECDRDAGSGRKVDGASAGGGRSDRERALARAGAWAPGGRERSARDKRGSNDARVAAVPRSHSECGLSRR